MQFIFDHFRATIKKLPTETDLQLYIELLGTVLACDRIGPLLQKQVLDAYFVGEICKNLFNSSAKELELVDSMVNLIVNDESKDFYTSKQIGSDPQRQ